MSKMKMKMSKMKRGSRAEGFIRVSGSGFRTGCSRSHRSAPHLCSPPATSLPPQQRAAAQEVASPPSPRGLQSQAKAMRCARPGERGASGWAGEGGRRTPACGHPRSGCGTPLEWRSPFQDPSASAAAPQRGRRCELLAGRQRAASSTGPCCPAESSPETAGLKPKQSLPTRGLAALSKKNKLDT